MKTTVNVQLFCPFCDYILKRVDQPTLKDPQVVVCDNLECPSGGVAFVTKPLEVELEVLGGPPNLS